MGIKKGPISNSDLIEKTDIVVSAVDNIFTLDLNAGNVFIVETADTNPKTIDFSNIPTIVKATVKLIYTNASAIIYPVGVTWDNSYIPPLAEGNQYEISFNTVNGTAWTAKIEKITPVDNDPLISAVKAAGGIFLYDANFDTVINGVANDRISGAAITWSGFTGNATSGIIPLTNGKKVRRFDGTNDFGDITDLTIQAPAQPFGVFATIKVNLSSTASAYIFCTGDTNAVGYALTHASGQNYNYPTARIADAEPGGTKECAPKGTFINIGYTLANNIIQLYVNGNKFGLPLAYSTGIISYISANIGRRQRSGGSLYYKGDIANVAVFKGVKCAEENIYTAIKEMCNGYVLTGGRLNGLL